MARVDHTFTMSLAPAQAQTMFVDEIAHELHAKAGLAMCKDEPGDVRFNDGDVDINSLPIAGGDNVGLYRGLGRGRGASNDVELYTGLRELTGHHLLVSFMPDGTGTTVRIHGHVEHKLRDAIDKLGQPGCWPETGFVHD
jgi:hypothetical protein